MHILGSPCWMIGRHDPSRQCLVQDITLAVGESDRDLVHRSTSFRSTKWVCSLFGRRTMFVPGPSWKCCVRLSGYPHRPWRPRYWPLMASWVSYAFATWRWPLSDEQHHCPVFHGFTLAHAPKYCREALIPQSDQWAPRTV